MPSQATDLFVLLNLPTRILGGGLGKYGNFFMVVELVERKKKRERGGGGRETDRVCTEREGRARREKEKKGGNLAERGQNAAGGDSLLRPVTLTPPGICFMFRTTSSSPELYAPEITFGHLRIGFLVASYWS